MRSVALGVLALLFLSTVAAGFAPIEEAAGIGPGDGETRDGTRIYVDPAGGGDYTTIQEAINAATPGDTIKVAPGTYLENLVIDKAVGLIGNWSSPTIIDGGGKGPVVAITSELVGLAGFTITNGGSNAGIDARGTRNGLMTDCIVTGNRVGFRGDQGCSDFRIVNSTFANNTKAGVWVQGNLLELTGCNFRDNGRGLMAAGGQHKISDTTFEGNEVGVSMGHAPERVLLMGNSYTQANSLDAILQRLLANTVPDASGTRLTSGGLRLSDHANNVLTPDHHWNTTLNGGTNWDAVVLQDQSQVPGFPTTHGSWQASLAGAEVLDDMTEEAGADTVLMMTWGRRDGDSTNPTMYPNYTVMQHRLEVGYLAYAENLSTPDRPVYVAPAGLAFQRIHDDIVAQGGDPLAQGSLFRSLYSSDGSHPSLSGSYLAASVLYATLTGNSPLGLVDPTPLDDAVKLQLQQAAEATVFVDTPDLRYPWRLTYLFEVLNNTFTSNGRGMVVGCLAERNEVADNAFEGNHGHAIAVLDVKSNSNVFHHNGLKDNNGTGWQAEDHGTNDRWHSSREGNWWSDYEVRYPGATNDGTVWNTPYDGLDLYPLVRHDAFPDVGLPLADAGPDQVVDPNVQVTFNGSGSTDDRGLTSWTWTFLYDDETVILEGVARVFRFYIPGVYRVTLEVMDSAGNRDTDHLNVTVRDVTDPVAVGIAYWTDDRPTARTLDGRSSTDNVDVVNWTWTFKDDGRTVQLYGDLVEYVFRLPATYLIELRVTDGAGNEDFDTIFVTIPDAEYPMADAGPDQEVDQGTIVVLDASGSSDNMGIDNYLWAFSYSGETVLLYGVEPTHLFGQVGVHTITLRVTDHRGNIAHDIVNITVRDITPPVAMAGEDIEVDSGDTIIFDAGDSADDIGIVVWSWELLYKGSTINGSEMTFTWTFEIPGLWTLRLTVEDAAGNSDVDQTIVTVIEIIDIIPPTVFAPTYNVEMGDNVTFDGTLSLDNVGIVKWTWVIKLPGEDEVLTGVNPTFKFDPPGRYIYTLTVEDAAGNSENASGLVIVKDTWPPTVPQFKDITIKSYGTLVLDASGATDNVGVVRYLWWYEIDGNEEVTLDGKRVEHQFPGEGDYTVHLTVWDAEGNMKTTSFGVHTEDSPMKW